VKSPKPQPVITPHHIYKNVISQHLGLPLTPPIKSLDSHLPFSTPPRNPIAAPQNPSSSQVVVIAEEKNGEMATVAGPVIWEIVKKNNSFLVKQFANGSARVRFSKEGNNLFNTQSYKHSGFANPKTVTIQAAGKDGVLVATSKTRKQNKPSSFFS
ncbi:Large ribosomal subunit protein eL28y-like protein, partial [Drosera capensis]